MDGFPDGVRLTRRQADVLRLAGVKSTTELAIWGVMRGLAGSAVHGNG
jgi:hypothetical protein